MSGTLDPDHLPDQDLEARTKRLLHRYLEEMPAVIMAQPKAQALGRINERDHLQPWSRDWLRDNLPQGHGTKLRTGTKLIFPEHFPRVGDVDITLEEPDVAPIFLELKCGASFDSLGDCAWDVVKLGVCLSQGACSIGYLVAATRMQWFEEGRLGTELLADGQWRAEGLRRDYSSWFSAYERRDDPPPRIVPQSGAISLFGAASFELGGDEWSLRIARVEVTDPAPYVWEPLL